MACPLKALGTPHPTLNPGVALIRHFHTEAKLDPIYTPDLGSGAENILLVEAEELA